MAQTRFSRIFERSSAICATASKSGSASPIEPRLHLTTSAARSQISDRTDITVVSGAIGRIAFVIEESENKSSIPRFSSAGGRDVVFFGLIGYMVGIFKYRFTLSGVILSQAYSCYPKIHRMHDVYLFEKYSSYQGARQYLA